MKKIILILFCLPLWLVAQQRADQLPEVESPADTDIAITVRGGSFFKTTFANLKTYFNTGAVDSLTLSNDSLLLYTSNDTLFVDLSDYAKDTDIPTLVSELTNDSGYLTAEVDGSITNEIQDISTNDTPGNITLSDGSTLTLNVEDDDADATNEIQTISIDSSGTSFTITLSDGGGSVTFEDSSSSGGVDSFTVADQAIYRNTDNAVTGNNILDVLSGALLPVQNNSKLTDTIQPPTGFTAPVPFWISRNEDGRYATQYDDIEVWRDSFLSDVPTDGVYYLDCIAGSDSNDGRTKATAKATMNAVRVLTPAPRRVYIKGGFYKTNTHSMGADTLQLIAYGGTPEIFRNITFPTWSLVGAGVYSTTQAAVGTGRILLSTKRDSDGVLVPLAQASSLAELTNATDTYYSDGTTFYVILDGSAPTEFVNIVIAAATHTGMTQTHLYANGIRWYGGISYGVSGGLFTMRDCSNYYLNEGSTVDLMAFTDGTVYMYNSRFGYAGSDAIDWNGATTIGYEINCTGRYAGLSGSGSNDQISTGHAGSRVATINADYQCARSQSIAEINTGTQRWILGGVFGNCWEFTSGAIGALTDSEVWVDNAKVGGRQLDYTVWNTGTLHLRNVNINQNSRIEIEAGGTINEY